MAHTFTQSELYDLLGPRFRDWHLASGFVMAESRGDPTARSKNPDGGENVGLFQIDTKTAKGAGFDPNRLEDPQYNAMVASHLSHKGATWKIWATAFTDPAHGKGYLSPDAPAVKLAKGAKLPDAHIDNPVLDPITGAASDVGDAVTAVPKFLGKLDVIFDGTWWLRVGQIALGVLAIGLALTFFGKEFTGGMPIPIPV